MATIFIGFSSISRQGHARVQANTACSPQPMATAARPVAGGDLLYSSHEQTPCPPPPVSPPTAPMVDGREPSRRAIDVSFDLGTQSLVILRPAGTAPRKRSRALGRRRAPSARLEPVQPLHHGLKESAPTRRQRHPSRRREHTRSQAVALGDEHAHASPDLRVHRRRRAGRIGTVDAYMSRRPARNPRATTRGPVDRVVELPSCAPRGAEHAPFA